MVIINQTVVSQTHQQLGDLRRLIYFFPQF